MRSILTLFFVFSAIGAFAQARTSDQQTNSRGSSSSSQVRESAPLPYNVDDKYMGRKAEFLGNTILADLPADFPVYDKKWSLKDYNKVVDAYYSKHLDILKESVKQKIQSLYPSPQK
jgi:hypothetical protein